MFIFTIFQVFKFAFQGFWRNFWLSVVTISVIILTFISINFLIAINKITESAILLVQDKIDVSLYFKNNIDEQTIQGVQNELQSISQVASVTFITQKEALELFRQKHKNDSSILQSLEELDGNPLGPTMRIKAKNINDYEDIIRIIDNSKYSSLIIDKNYEDNRPIIEKINTVSRNINKFGISITFIFTVIAILIVFNTIKLAIYTHEKEITIMKLVGASNAFISFPYIIESMLYAVFACVFSIAILFPILSFIQPYILIFFKGFEGQVIDMGSYFNKNFFTIFGIELIGIIILNIIASSIAIRRYLKV